MQNLIRNIGGGADRDGYVQPRTRTPVFALTEEGKTKLSTLETGDIDYRIMSEIHAGYTLNLDEISTRTSLAKAVIKEHLRTLHAQGYITVRNTYQ